MAPNSSQEIFDAVVSHARQQNKRAVMDPDHADDLIQRCRYRASDGSKCFVGCLISDEAYSENLEGESVSNQVVQRALQKSGVQLSDHAVHLLCELQRVHDTRWTTAWEAGFETVAKRWGVKYTAPATYTGPAAYTH